MRYINITLHQITLEKCCSEKTLRRLCLGGSLSYKTLTQHKMSESGNVENYLKRFFDAKDKLESVGVRLNDDLLFIMLHNLPLYENFHCSIESRDELPEVEAFKIKDKFNSRH